MNNTVTAQQTKWGVDPAHSEITFKVRHMMIASVTGQFESFTAIAETNGDSSELHVIRLSLFPAFHVGVKGIAVSAEIAECLFQDHGVTRLDRGSLDQEVMQPFLVFACLAALGMRNNGKHQQDKAKACHLHYRVCLH